MTRRSLLAVLSTLAALGVLTLATSSSAAEPTAAWWKLSSSSTPTFLHPGEPGSTVAVTASNVGDATVTGVAHNVTITDTLPAGIKIGEVTPVTCHEALAKSPVCATRWPLAGSVEKNPSCTHAETAGRAVATCTFKEDLAPFEQWEMQISVNVEASALGAANLNRVAVTGGEAKEATLERPLTVNEASTPFGIQNYDLLPENEVGDAETQAGAHPFQFTTTFQLNRVYHKFPNGKILPTSPELSKDVRVNLPPGLIGNASKEIVHQCTELQFTSVLSNNESNQCPPDTAVGVAIATLTEPNVLEALTIAIPVYNLVPSRGEPARFGFLATTVPITLDTVVREGDYHVVVNVNNISQFPALLGSQVTIWGVPGDPRHDQSRGSQCLTGGTLANFEEACTLLKTAEPAPFITLPTSCEALQTSVTSLSWVLGASFLNPVSTTAAPQTGCDKLPFTPTMTVQPTQHETNTPTGLKVLLKLPQPSTLVPEALAEANVRNTTVTLPSGIQLSPSAADGLQSCSLGQIGFEHANPTTGVNEFNSTPAACPAASKVGTVRIKTPVIEHELHGAVYLAAQSENPFGSLFGLYIVVEDPVSGVLVKLAGKVSLDTGTGQITTTFPNAPQLPFEELELELNSGPRASIATPRACGSGYSTQASFSPWSGTAPVSLSLNPAEAAFTSGPHGTGCASPQPFAPGFQAGTSNSQAAAFTPFTLSLTRDDTNQAVKGLSVTLPPGMAGLLSTVVQCPEPQAEEGTCGEASLIGHATAVSGLGSDPFTIGGGRVYITGPYHGAPFGLSIVIPAVAGPFNFGNVVTRSTINVDPTTAALTISSDLPTMVNTRTYQTGVPVQLRRVDVTVERPGGAPFQFNPTNCSPMKITGTLSGDEGATHAVESPFQVANCSALPFHPKLTASTSAQASKVNGEALNVNVESAGLGQANIAKVFLTLPKILPSRLSTIQKACLQAVFAANPATCPEGSLIGKATIHTPVLTSPLTGPAYLVSHGGAAFPDVEFVLQGEGITLILDGKTDIKNGITYSRFESAPDAPFTKFETELPAGPHSALTAFVPASQNYNVCKSAASLAMPTEITAQNGNVVKQTTKIAVKGCPKAATRAQLLAKALKSCKKKKAKGKRVACEKQARKKYGPKKAAKKKK